MTSRIDTETAIRSAIVSATVILGILPFALYAWARSTGSLPSEEEWYRRGGNHGPWWLAPQGWTIGLPLFLLSLLTILTALVMQATDRRRRLIWRVVPWIQLGLAWYQLVYLYWTID